MAFYAVKRSWRLAVAMLVISVASVSVALLTSTRRSA
jgi:hypothetical protein